MKRQGQQAAGQSKKTKVVAALPPAPAPAVSGYRNFLNNYIVGKTFKNPTGNKSKFKIPPAQIRRWQEPTLTPEGVIQNEIAKGFHDKQGDISRVTYRDGGPGSSSLYWSDPNNNQNYLQLVPRHLKKDGPNPLVVAHELVHAADHQAETPADRLNPKVWGHLESLARPMMNFPQFSNSVKNIQDKITPTGEFSANYPIGRGYIEQEMHNADGSGGQLNYHAPFTAVGVPDWGRLFGDINAVVTHPAPAGAGAVPLKQNQGYYLNRASEFPAYISERLTKHWDVRNLNPQAAPITAPLSQPEARVLYNTLGDMAQAYPVAPVGAPVGTPSYPIMNQHIMARRNSIADAYYPPAAGGAPGSGVPVAGFSRGGVIRSKSQNNRRGLSDYLNGINSHKRVNFLTF